MAQPSRAARCTYELSAAVAAGYATIQHARGDDEDRLKPMWPLAPIVSEE
eukprot:CAMPEP_0183336298 /NCGR_PEP_ID=MMETSP0164_2-20130417/4311_1 /TAXON_ID=221442 /ORGANISM="Coccolithus pelagicus ssp braarudi, Strain PLY182g" /LENGTH=49 /DNA_ID=CAMNT_0025505783 /DNA_START=267 /DNA_END=416 /DNA_ORIENTATION=-